MKKKQCRKCGKKKPTAEFYSRKDYGDGFSSLCRKCYLENYRNRKIKKVVIKKGDETESICDGSWMGSGQWIY